MASFEQLGAVPSGLTVDELAGTVSKISKELNWLLRNLDDLNISSVTTDKIIAGTAKISTALIEDLIVGGNVTMGENATISWGQVTDADTYSLSAWKASGYATYIDANGIYTGELTANQINAIQGITLGEGASINWSYVTKPGYTASEVGALSDSTFIPDDYYITTITENTVKTTNVIAQNLTVKAANISGILTANQITTNIAQVNSTLQLGGTIGTGRSIIFGSNASIENPLNTENLTISAFYRIDLDAQNGAYVNNSKIATESWVSDNFASDVHSHSYVTFSALNTEINNAMTSHLNMYHAT